MKSYLGQMHNVLYLLLTVTQGFCFFYTLTVFVLYGMPIKYFDLKLSTVIVFFFPWETNHDMWVDLEAHISWRLVPSLSCFSKLPFSTRPFPDALEPQRTSFIPFLSHMKYQERLVKGRNCVEHGHIQLNIFHSRSCSYSYMFGRLKQCIIKVVLGPKWA